METKLNGFKRTDWYCRDEVGNIYGYESEAAARRAAKLFQKNGMMLCKSETRATVVRP